MLFFSKTVTAGCGHETKKSGKIIVGGRTFKVELNKESDLCLACLEKMSIRCPRSGKLIRADGELLDLVEDKRLRDIPYAVFYEDKVICLHVNHIHHTYPSIPGDPLPPSGRLVNGEIIIF